jgi:lysophospholipase L1-like esterase
MVRVKRIILCGAFLMGNFCPLAVAGDLGGLHAELGRKWPANRSINIVFHGHSVPAGYHKTPEVKPFESYPHLVHLKLKELYPYAVLNVTVTAIGGEDSTAGSSRFTRDVLSHKPDLIFIDYALNDRRKPLEKVEASWRSMIGEAKKSGVPVVLLTPTGDAAADLAKPGDPLRQRADLIRRLAKNEDVPLADVSAAWLAELGKGTPQDQLLSQPNHPNLRGHTVAADTIVAALAAAGLKP